MAAIYRFVNKENGKQYIGSTTRNPKRRITEHKSRLRHGKHHGNHFQRAWDKYGEDSFEAEILFEDDVSEEVIRLIERMYLHNLEPEYCESLYPTKHYMYGRNGKEHPNYGRKFGKRKHSKETRKLMSQSRSTKLNTEEVELIRKLYASGEYHQWELGEMFNVRQDHISRIVNYKARGLQ